MTGRIHASRLCLRGKSASFVRHIEIDVGDTPLAGRFAAGQSIGVVLPDDLAGDSGGHPRSFSIASPGQGEDGDGRVLAVTAKRIIAERRPIRAGDDPDDHGLVVGRASNYLCDLRPGDPVCLSGPLSSAMALPDDLSAHQYVFVATGTGVAPFRGMLLELLRGKDGPINGRIHLIAGAPYSSDLVYDTLFRELEEQHANFRYHPVISREPDECGEIGSHVHHYLERCFPTFESTLRDPATVLYICGLGGMERGLFEALREQGAADRFLVAEPATSPVAVRPTERCRIEVFGW